jgi:hypothetical protein
VRSFFSFPSTVSEVAARVVATGVVAQCLLFLFTGSGWWLLPLVYGFLARVATGPKASPLGQLATRVVAPRLGGDPRRVPGNPKRFAQAIGLVFSSVAAAAFAVGETGWATATIAMLAMAAFAEAALGVCFGCVIYNRLWGCDDCADIGDRLEALVAGLPINPHPPVGQGVLSEVVSPDRRARS